MHRLLTVRHRDLNRFAYAAAIALLLGVRGTAAPAAQSSSESVPPFHRAFDQLLDLNVRDGLVYYRALKSDRSRLDRYVASLNVPKGTYDGWSRDDQMAFWINGYNAIVLKTVIDHYPIRGKSSMYPPASIRQIPGAFERQKHSVAGQSLTLDEIEKTILPKFNEPRLYLALGRGAVGSGRLRSEAYVGSRLPAQLTAVQSEFVADQTMLKIDRLTGQMSATPLISWHEAEFVAAYDKGATGPYAQRSPIERALIAFVTPHLLRLEKEFVEKNDFQIVFHQFDWRLNDLSGGRTE